MKQVSLLLILTLTSFAFLHAQTDSTAAKPWKSPFKRGYIRLGIDKLGSNLNTAVALQKCTRWQFWVG